MEQSACVVFFVIKLRERKNTRKIYLKIKNQNFRVSLSEHTVRQREIELVRGGQLRLIDRDAETVAVLALGRHAHCAAGDLKMTATAIVVVKHRSD
jgi:hypothetical protein